MDTLSELVDGLLVPSETDRAMVPFRWVGHDEGEVSVPALLSAQGLDPSASVRVETVREFFGPMIEEPSWFGEAERQTAKRFRKLVEYWEHEVRDARVYRVGDVAVTVLILGRVSGREWVGLRTSVVET